MDGQKAILKKSHIQEDNWKDSLKLTDRSMEYRKLKEGILKQWNGSYML